MFQINYGATDPVLNDRVQYPYYFSTGPNEHVQHIAISELVKHLGWTWVIILAVDDDHAERESKNIRNEITKHGVWVDFIGTLKEDKNTDMRTLERIQKSTAEVVILCGELFRTKSLMFLAEKMIKDKTLVLPVTWIPIYTMLLFNGSLLFIDTSIVFDYKTTFHTHVMATEENTSLKDILAIGASCLTHDKEKDELFQQVYNHKCRNCSRLKIIHATFYPSHRVLRAVKGLVHATHNLLSTYRNKDIHKNIPRKEISYGATDPELNDRVQYPYYFSTGPNDYIQHVAIAELVEHLRWTWVIILAAVNERSERESNNLKNEITKRGACIDFIGTLTGNKNSDIGTLERIQKSTAEVVIFFGELFRTKFLMFLVEKMIKDKTLVLPVTWVPFYTMFLFNGSLHFIETLVVFDDSTKFTAHVMAIEEDMLLKDLLTINHFCLTHDKEKDDLFQQVYNYTYWNCSRLKLAHNTFYPSHRVLRAVKGLAHATHNLLSTYRNKDIHKNIPRKESHLMIHSIFQLHQYLRNVRFNERQGSEIAFNELMKSPVHFIIYAIHSKAKFVYERIQVGNYFWSETGSSLAIDAQRVIWKKTTNNQTLKSQCSSNCPPGYRKSQREWAPPCCYDCARCSEGEISNITDMDTCLKCGDYEWPNKEKTVCFEKQIEFLSYTGDSLVLAFIVHSLVFFLMAAVILGIFISFRDTPVVKANNRNLSFILLVSIKLSFLSVFLFLGQPTDITCMLRQTSFGITFSIAMSSVLAKTILVCIAFKATKPDSPWRKWVGVKMAYYIVFFCSVIQILISVIWLATSSPFVEHNILSEPGKIIIECNEGSVIAFYIVLSYMGLLASVSFIVAFLARTLPDSFNEAKYITFSMLLFCSVWITMIPAYLSTKGKNMVAVEIFAIITSSCGLLFCIFLPKCYIVLLKPEINTKQYLLENNK
ncbi:hypothetical protein XELAEV_18008712mg [Xenopus laevis]|uniref:G-protein coupled receptors family 3 profile domain-containing protein n=1 Tax=Xenopus laevis TaxID=8355 RepID=A0A974DR84_XENLA|nr:hypothetical protein XELAEV_18008712mg [Xenopus laevis]